jgi:hypothetical protein
MMLRKPGNATVLVGLLILDLCGLGIGGVQLSSAQDPKAAATQPPPVASPAQPSGAGLPPLNVPKSLEAQEEAHSRGTVFVVLRVTDSGTRVQRQERQVVVRLPERKAETIAASPGCAILGVKLPQPNNSALEHLQVIVTRDRRAAELAADRVGGNGGDTKGARPSPIEIPLTVIEERASEVRGPTQKLAVCSDAVFDFQPTSYALPPIPSELVRPRRRIDVEIRGAGEGGQSNLLLSEADIQLPWKGAVFRSKSGAFCFYIEQVGDQLQVWNRWMLH